MTTENETKASDSSRSIDGLVRQGFFDRMKNRKKRKLLEQIAEQEAKAECYYRIMTTGGHHSSWDRESWCSAMQKAAKLRKRYDLLFA